MGLLSELRHLPPSLTTRVQSPELTEDVVEQTGYGKLSFDGIYIGVDMLVPRYVRQGQVYGLRKALAIAV